MDSSYEQETIEPWETENFLEATDEPLAENYEEAREDKEEEFFREDDFSEYGDTLTDELREDDFSEYGDALDGEEWESTVADALDGENFLRSLAKGLGVVAPSVARLAGRLAVEGVQEEEALAEMLNWAEEKEALDEAIPMIAGLSIRRAFPQAARLPRSTRRQLVQQVGQATRTLARRQGFQAVRAIPRILQAVERSQRRQGFPPRQLPMAVSRATAQIVRNPPLVNRLLRSYQPTRVGIMHRSAPSYREAPRRIIIHGPVEIIIRSGWGGDNDVSVY